MTVCQWQKQEQKPDEGKQIIGQTMYICLCTDTFMSWLEHFYCSLEVAALQPSIGHLTWSGFDFISCL